MFTTMALSKKLTETTVQWPQWDWVVSTCVWLTLKSESETEEDENDDMAYFVTVD